jgi:hypothetical protein
VLAGFWWGNLRERDSLEKLDIDGRIILRFYLKEIGWDIMDWTDLARVRDTWRALVNTKINFLISLKSGNFSTSWGTVSFSRRAPLHGINIKVWHRRCACRTRNMKDVVCRHTNFIIANPVTSTCFGCTQQTMRNYVSENVKKKLYSCNRTCVLFGVAETCRCYWICYNKYMSTDYVLVNVGLSS